MLNRETIFITMGASKWPNCHALEELPACLESAKAFESYIDSPYGFNLARGMTLNLFDEDLYPGDLNKKITEFISRIRKNNEISNVIFYIVGHGAFHDHKYFVALRSFDERFKGETMYSIEYLVKLIRNVSSDVRNVVIIDACYAGAALREFASLSSELDVEFQEILRRSLNEAEQPEKGIALLCASGPKQEALAPKGQKLTMFTGALLKVLEQEGCEDSGEYLSLRTLCQKIRNTVSFEYGKKGIDPQLHLPDQTDCADFLDAPLFPNPNCGTLLQGLSDAPQQQLIFDRNDHDILEEALCFSCKATQAKFLEQMDFSAPSAPAHSKDSVDGAFTK